MPWTRSPLPLTVVTSASGTVGSAVVAELGRAGLAVRATSRDPAAHDWHPDVLRATLDLDEVATAPEPLRQALETSWVAPDPTRSGTRGSPCSPATSTPGPATS